MTVHFQSQLSWGAQRWVGLNRIFVGGSILEVLQEVLSVIKLGGDYELF